MNSPTELASTVQEISAGVEETYGYDSVELTCKSIFDYLHPEDVTGIQAQLRRMIEDESTTDAIEASGKQTWSRTRRCRTGLPADRTPMRARSSATFPGVERA
ncbi:PAS domain-containing protein [Acrocarpospora sp. B8E8]|uniref:PAS domain-containing protein n=1 Tax=Acrocarpospora sp. B8E8 TaxID=3153572 RepID=UPI00325D6253